MAKSASLAVLKWQSRTGVASGDYLEGAKTTDKDQSQRAIASKELYKAALQESFTRDAFAKGLQKSGKAGWIAGIEEKGQTNYLTGVSADKSRSRYVENSSKFDSARKAADAMPRGPKGSAQNIAKVTAVVNALRAVKASK